VFATCAGLCGDLATCRGLATCFGATTVMLGSGAAEPVAVCDIAVSLRLHSNAVDRIAIAEGATKLDNDLMIISGQIQDGHSVPMRTRYHTYSTSKFRIWPLGVETISGDDPPSTDSSPARDQPRAVLFWARSGSRSWSLVPFQLPLSPMMILARSKFPNIATVQRPHDADARKHRRPVMFGNQQ
jgi:hypothetical protein